MRHLILALALAAPVQAAVTTQPCDYADKLRAQLRDQGTPPTWWNNGDGSCTLAWTDKQPAFVFVDLQAQKDTAAVAQQTKRDELLAAAALLDDKIPVEHALRLLIDYVLSQEAAK